MSTAPVVTDPEGLAWCQRQYDRVNRGWDPLFDIGQEGLEECKRRVWAGQSPLFCLRKDDCIVGPRVPGVTHTQ